MLSENAEIIMGQSPKTADVNTDGEGLPLLNGPTEFGPSHPTPSQFTTKASKQCQEGDLLFCVRGSTTGRMNWADQPYAIGRGIAAIRHKQGLHMQPFLRAVIEHELRDLLLQATGSTFPNVSSALLSSLQWPDLHEDYQANASQYFQLLADKINLLREMNRTLEDIARAVFRAWFVDFDPVRAKAAGATSFRGMPQDLFDLLPDSLETSEIGNIPAGWYTEPLIDQADWINGAAYKNMHFSTDADALPVVKITELKKGISTSTKFTNTDLGDKYRIKSGELMFSWSGSPETSIDAFIWALGDAWLNQHIFVVRPNGKRNVGYLFALLKHLKPKFIAIAKDKQTTGLGHVTRDDMKRMHVCKPSEEILGWFSDFGQNIYDRILSNLVEMDQLATLRDTLLPKLLSGELEAPSLDALGLGGDV